MPCINKIFGTKCDEQISVFGRYFDIYWICCCCFFGLFLFQSPSYVSWSIPLYLCNLCVSSPSFSLYLEYYFSVYFLACVSVFCKCFIFWFLILQPQHSTSTQCMAYYTTMPSHRSCSVLHFRSHMIWSVYGLIVPQLVFSGRRTPSKIFGCKHTK